MIQLDKKSLRKEVRARKKQFSTEELINESRPLIQRVLNHPRLQSAKTVLLYNSLPDEVYTHDLIKQLHNEGKTVLLPVVISDTEMELRLYRNPNSFETSSYGILEPIGEAFTDFSSIEFALIPGMAFDKERNRLGRGKGYYDRFLPLLINAYKVGICFPFQFLPNIPTEETDIKVDECIY
nr:5-formyltetrahydrofolate cyclo-ligase [uncultured Prevotella sp.]